MHDKAPPKNDRVVMTQKRALKDPVLKAVIDYADTELALHMRVNIAPMIKRLDLGQHREFIRKHCKGVVREILEERFGPLIAVTLDGGIAGKGGGSYTTGYRRAVQEYGDLADASLKRKQGIASGISGAHNELAGAIGGATGETRAMLTVEVSNPALEKPEAALRITDGSTLDLAKRALAALINEADEKAA